MNGGSLIFPLLLAFGFTGMTIDTAARIVPRPPVEVRAYTDVSVIRNEVVDGWWRVRVAFKKSAGCNKKEFQIVGARNVGTPGVEFSFLNWSDDDGLATDHDRAAGFTVLTGKVWLAGRKFDWLEARTKHECADGTADAVLLRYEGRK